MIVGNHGTVSRAAIDKGEDPEFGAGLVADLAVALAEGFGAGDDAAGHVVVGTDVAGAPEGDVAIGSKNASPSNEAGMDWRDGLFGALENRQHSAVAVKTVGVVSDSAGQISVVSFLNESYK